MILKRHWLLFALLVPFAGLPDLSGGEEAASAHPSMRLVPKPAEGTVSPGYLPRLDPDLTDLDARDSQNRPISSPSAQTRLVELFVENLYALTAQTSPHALQQAWTLLEAGIRRFHDAILDTVKRGFRQLLAVFQPPQRRVVHNVNNLWISFSVGVFASALARPGFSLHSPLLRLPLRC